MVGPAGIEPAYAGLRPAANPSQLETHGREAGTRTPSYLVPGQACLPLHHIPEDADAARWRWRESNPLRRRLQGVPATSAVIPMVRCGARYSQSPGVAGLSSAASPSYGRHGGPPLMVLTLWTYQQASTFTLGWCSTGTAGVEPAFRSGWSRVAYPLADPQVNENRPGIPLGRLPSPA